MSDVTVKLSADDVNVEETLKGIQKDLQNMGDKAKASTKKADTSFAKLAASGAAMGAGIAVGIGAVKAAFAALEATLDGFGRAITLAADWQQMEVAFETLIGNSKLAKGFLTDLKDFAAKTPFSIVGLGDAAKTLLAFGQSSQEVIPTLKMLGDVAMGNEEKLQSLARAFGKIQSQGKLTGEELNMMIDAGFNPLREISEMTGKSIAELRKDMEKGAISADMVTAAFKRATSEGGAFFGMTEKQSKTFNGVMSTLKDTIDEAFRTLGTPIIDALTPIITKWTEHLNKIIPIFGLIGDAIGGAITWFEKWLSNTFKVEEAVGNIGEALKGLATGQTGAVLENLFLSMQKWAMETANEIHRQLIAAFTSVASFLGDMFSLNGALMTTITDSFSMLGNKVGANIMRSIAGALGDNMLTAGIAKGLNEAANEANTTANKIEDSLKGAGGRIKDQFVEAGKAMPDSFDEAYKKVPPLFKDLDKLQQKIDANNQQISKSAAEYVMANNEALEIEKEKAKEAVKVAEANLEKAEAAQAALDVQKEEYAKELELLEAKKSGNKELVKKLEHEKAYEAALKKNISLYGDNVEEAERLAKKHADAVAPLQTIGDLLDELAGKKVDPFEEAGSTQEKLNVIRDGLKGIESSLDMSLGSNRDWRDLTDIFGIDTFGRQANDALADVNQRMKDISDVPLELQAKLKEMGVKKFFEWWDAEKAKDQKVDTKITADTKQVTDAKQKLDEAKQALQDLGGTTAIPKINIDTKEIDDAVKKIESTPVDVDVQADPSTLQSQLSNVKAELKNSFTGGDGKGGDGGEGGEGGEGGAMDDEESSPAKTLGDILTEVKTIVKNWPVAVLA